MSSIDIAGIQDALVSHAMASGLFGQVNGHEPESAPPHGLTAAVWVESVGPARSSGLQVTSGLLVFTVRIYTPMLTEPRDAIDPAMVHAVDVLLASYSADFDLDGLVRNVDLLGQAGAPLGARAGYLRQDGGVYRVYDITVPMIVNDLWPQAA